jgi:hypothetical protein
MKRKIVITGLYVFVLLSVGWWLRLTGSAAYFRIQGPTLLIEYSPQRSRGGGPDTNHIHTIYRDPTNDYGARLVKR